MIHTTQKLDGSNPGGLDRIEVFEGRVDSAYVMFMGCFMVVSAFRWLFICLPSLLFALLYFPRSLSDSLILLMSSRTTFIFTFFFSFSFRLSNT